jgi:hypothetical protein
MYYDELIENADELSFNNDNKNKVNEFVKDKRTFTVKRVNHEGRLKKVQVFSSGPIGHTIRNAVSGFKYTGDIVGSKAEDQYFKVRICNGEANNDGKLFYENPEQYENQMFEEIPQDIKEAWHKKFLDFKYKL